MKLLVDYTSELEEKKKSSEKLATQLLEQVRTMWLRLNISESYMTDFLSTTAGFKPHCIQALEAELLHCHELQKQNVGQLIDVARDDVQQHFNCS